MRKLFTILAVIIFFLTQIGYYSWYALSGFFQVQKMEQYLLSTIHEKDCEIINLTTKAGDITWEKPGEIFFLDGKMYDVAKTKMVNGNVYLYCITEQKEMEMLGDITLKISSGYDGTKICNLEFTEEYTVPEENNTGLILKDFSNKYPRNSSDATDQLRKIIIPPPRV